MSNFKIHDSNFISIKAASLKVGLSVTTIRRLVKDNKFPQPIYLTEKRIAFLESEVQNWMIEIYMKGKAQNDN